MTKEHNRAYKGNAKTCIHISDLNSTGKNKRTPIHLTQPEVDLFVFSAEKLHPSYIMI